MAFWFRFLLSDFSTILSQLPIPVARACGAWVLVASRSVLFEILDRFFGLWAFWLKVSLSRVWAFGLTILLVCRSLLMVLDIVRDGS